MKRILFIFCSALIVASCNTKQTNSKETANAIENDGSTLYVATMNDPELDTTTTHVKKLSELPPVKGSNNVTKPFTENRLELSLNVLANKSGYLAQRNVTEPTSDKGNYKVEYIAVDWCGGPKTFKTTEEFLNFISEHGYKLASQTENAHGIDYIFDKI